MLKKSLKNFHAEKIKASNGTELLLMGNTINYECNEPAIN